MPRGQQNLSLKISNSIQEIRGAAAESARSRIQANEIVTRLCRFMLGQTETLSNGQIVVVELSPAQVMAARILLAKVLPDLQTVTVEKKDPLQDMTTNELKAHLALTFKAIQDAQTIDQIPVEKGLLE